MAGGRNLCRHSHHLLRTRRIPAVAAAKKKLSLRSVPKPRLPTSARPLLSFSPSSSLFSLFPLTAHSFFFTSSKASLSLSPAARSSLVSANRFVGTAAVKYPRPGRFQCRCFVALVSGREKPKFRIETNYSS